jgi:hypothetical protein
VLLCSESSSSRAVCGFMGVFVSHHYMYRAGVATSAQVGMQNSVDLLLRALNKANVKVGALYALTK